MPPTPPDLYAQRRVRLLRVAPELLLTSLATGNRINVTVVQGVPPDVQVVGAYTGVAVDGRSREIVLILVSPTFEVAEADFPSQMVTFRAEPS